MARPNRPPALRALRRSWRRWSDVVELFANRRPGWQRVDPGAYQSLYEELLRDCRAAAEEADGPGRECAG